MSISRRGMLALLGTGSALALPSISLAQQPPRELAFAHGVASGDPAADGAVIWTRASAEAGYGGDIALEWMVAASPDSAPVVRGRVAARSSADHTAKVEVSGLAAGQDYHYWFEGPGGARSAIGRFRTLPVGSTDEVVFAVASCQLWSGGLFNAFADMARLERLDAVIHLGDYIYEYGDTGFGTDIGRQLGRMPDPAHQIVTLADYRRRHAQVKTDPHMQAAHARAAFICVWDDHEITNDAWIGGAENHAPGHGEGGEGDWEARKAVAMQAYFEWMPIRDPSPVRARAAIFRSFEFGDLATLAMVETRILVRDEQAAPKGDVPADEQIAGILAVRDQPERELLGPDQSDWLEAVLAASVQAGKPWQLLGNQVIMARVAGPDLETALGSEVYSAMLAAMPDPYRAQIGQAIAGYRSGVPFNLDAWDGYPHARERLYDLFARANSRPLVLSGDSHAAWTNNLADAAGRSAAIEVGCTAISSPSYGSLLPGLGRVLASANPEVAFCDQDRKGYSIVTLTPDHVRAEHIAVSTVFSPTFDRSVIATHVAQPGLTGATFAPA